MPKITLYSRTSCAPCKTLKYWLGKKNIPYNEKNLDDNPDFALELPFLLVPSLRVGDELIQGLKFEAISEAIGL